MTNLVRSTQKSTSRYLYGIILFFPAQIWLKFTVSFVATQTPAGHSPVDIMSLLTSDDDSLSEGSPLIEPNSALVSPQTPNRVKSPLLNGSDSARELYRQLGLGITRNNSSSSDISRKPLLQPDRRTSVQSCTTPVRDPYEVTIVTSSSKMKELDTNSNVITRFSQNLASKSNNFLHQQKAISTTSFISEENRNLLGSDLALSNVSDQELSLCSITPTSTFNTLSTSHCTLSVSDEITTDKTTPVSSRATQRGKAAFSAPVTPAINAGEFFIGGDKAKKKRLRIFTKKKTKSSAGSSPAANSHLQSGSPQSDHTQSGHSQSGSPLRVLW